MCGQGSKRRGSPFRSSKVVTMTMEPQSTSQVPVNTSLRKASVWNVYLPQKMGGREGGREGKEAS